MADNLLVTLSTMEQLKHLSATFLIHTGQSFIFVDMDLLAGFSLLSFGFVGSWNKLITYGVLNWGPIYPMLLGKFHPTAAGPPDDVFC